jgi:hypothetical protein
LKFKPSYLNVATPAEVPLTNTISDLHWQTAASTRADAKCFLGTLANRSVSGPRAIIAQLGKLMEGFRIEAGARMLVRSSAYSMKRSAGKGRLSKRVYAQSLSLRSAILHSFH